MEQFKRGIFMNNTQFAVKFNADTLAWLKENDYANTQRLTAQNYSFPVIIVDKTTQSFFGTNTTCMAAMKPKVIGVEQLKNLLK